MSCRRMLVLISTLPEDSAVGRIHSERDTDGEMDNGDVTVIRSGEAFAHWMNSTAKKA